MKKHIMALVLLSAISLNANVIEDDLRYGNIKQATVCDSIRAETLLRVMEDEGYKVEIGSYEEGSGGSIRYLIWQINGYKAIVNPKKNSISFTALMKVTEATIEDCNSWNAKYNFAKVYKEDSKVFLELDLPMIGGVTEDNIKSWIRICYNMHMKWILSNVTD